MGGGAAAGLRSPGRDDRRDRAALLQRRRGAAGDGDTDARRLVPALAGAVAGTLPPAQIGSLASRRDFVHVADVARAFTAALAATGPGSWQVYNVGSGTATSVADLIGLLERMAGRQLPHAAAPAGTAPDEDRGYADISAIRARLGWRPTLTPTDIARDAWHAARAPDHDRD